MGDIRSSETTGSPDNLSKGLFSCKICQTVHWSWNSFSKHFLKVHGTSPKIVLRYNNNNNNSNNNSSNNNNSNCNNNPQTVLEQNNNCLTQRQQVKCLKDNEILSSEKKLFKEK